MRTLEIILTAQRSMEKCLRRRKEAEAGSVHDGGQNGVVQSPTTDREDRCHTANNPATGRAYESNFSLNGRN